MQYHAVVRIHQTQFGLVARRLYSSRKSRGRSPCKECTCSCGIGVFGCNGNLDQHINTIPNIGIHHPWVNVDGTFVFHSPTAGRLCRFKGMPRCISAWSWSIALTNFMQHEQCIHKRNGFLDVDWHCNGSSPKDYKSTNQKQQTQSGCEWLKLQAYLNLPAGTAEYGVVIHIELSEASIVLPNRNSTGLVQEAHLQIGTRDTSLQMPNSQPVVDSLDCVTTQRFHHLRSATSKRCLSKAHYYCMMFVMVSSVWESNVRVSIDSINNILVLDTTLHHVSIPDAIWSHYDMGESAATN